MALQNLPVFQAVNMSEIREVMAVSAALMKLPSLLAFQLCPKCLLPVIPHMLSGGLCFQPTSGCFHLSFSISATYLEELQQSAPVEDALVAFILEFSLSPGSSSLTGCVSVAASPWLMAGQA